MGKYKRVAADMILLLVVLIWGTTFAIMKDALETIRPLNFIFLRFTLATLVMVIINWRRLKRLNWQTIKMGGVLGLALAGAYFFQISGLQFTTASKAGFITGLSVVLVPVLSTIYYKKIPARPVLLGVILAAIGLFLLSYDGNWALNKGDLLVLFCALALAFHIFYVGQFVQKEDPALLNIVQIGVVAMVAGLGSTFSGNVVIHFPPKIWLGIIYMAVLATGVAFFVQNWAQQFTSANRTGIIFSMEPVFAMIFAWLLLGESITSQSLVGGSFIVFGMILAELGEYLKSGRKAKE